nr:MAG TPA: hypothetical protein [Caudoviricetes sp.]
MEYNNNLNNSFSAKIQNDHLNHKNIHNYLKIQ